MSWCRWGSPCWGTFPAGYYAIDRACTECPGSDLFIYESTEGGIMCDGCRFGGDFRAQTEDEMLDHIEKHVAAGHHVRPSLRRGADLTVVPQCQWMEDIRQKASQSESEEQKK